MEIQDRRRRLAELVAEIDALQAELAGCLRAILSVLAETPLDAGAPRGRTDFPVLDDHTFTVHWGAYSCCLGCTLAFRLLRRLARRPNFYVSCDQLRDDVWHTAGCADSTIRSEVRHLRHRLREAHMEQLADAIRSHKRHYVLLL